MNKHVFSLVFFVMACVVLFHPGCNNGSNGGTQYILNVTLSSGVTGTPSAGTFSYGENDTVTYSYAAQAGYGGLAVILDGVTVGNSGIITMNTNHTLSVTAAPDIRGNWQGLHTDDNNSQIFQVVFGGASPASGTVTGNIGGPNGSGTFTVSGSNISFYIDFGFARFDCTGTITDMNHMSGTWTNAGGFSGTWNLTRT